MATAFASGWGHRDANPRRLDAGVRWDLERARRQGNHLDGLPRYGLLDQLDFNRRAHHVNGAFRQTGQKSIDNRDVGDDNSEESE